MKFDLERKFKMKSQTEKRFLICKNETNFQFKNYSNSLEGNFDWAYNQILNGFRV